MNLSLPLSETDHVPQWAVSSHLENILDSKALLLSLSLSLSSPLPLLFLFLYLSRSRRFVPFSLPPTSFGKQAVHLGNEAVSKALIWRRFSFCNLIRSSLFFGLIVGPTWCDAVVGPTRCDATEQRRTESAQRLSLSAFDAMMSVTPFGKQAAHLGNIPVSQALLLSRFSWPTLRFPGCLFLSDPFFTFLKNGLMCITYSRLES